MTGVATHPQPAITDEQVRFFHDNGFLVLRGVLQAGELARMRSAMDGLLAYGLEEVRDHPDYAYGRGHLTGRPILQRIEYVIDKTEEGKVLLAHPFILRSVERLQGKDLIPTWDSMVLKMPGEGIMVPWHRDAGTECVGDTPIFNVDFYMDDADLDTCLWVYPGSHKWSREETLKVTQQEGFATDGATPVPVHAGDAIFHNILVLHGSPSNISRKLRRVVYFEFRSAHVELALGPHVPEYIPLKQKVLLGCLERRSKADYVHGEEPYRYEPPEPFEVDWKAGTELETYRYPHEQFWRR
jgi:ectoine hydroxylase-related dioxygenase (phytanoyl-CoA dioxygenase family)